MASKTLKYQKQVGGEKKKSVIYELQDSEIPPGASRAAYYVPRWLLEKLGYPQELTVTFSSE